MWFLEAECASSGVPWVSRAWGQSQFGCPHPVCSWQHRCDEWVGSKRASKAESGPTYSCF